jgi:hypothetical protein
MLVLAINSNLKLTIINNLGATMPVEPFPLEFNNEVDETPDKVLQRAAKGIAEILSHGEYRGCVPVTKPVRIKGTAITEMVGVVLLIDVPPGSDILQD